MRCPRCHTENPERAKFCNECAFDLRRPGNILHQDDLDPPGYTPKFLADKILSHRHVIEGERKSVTVLFADVAGYTAIAESLDPEQVHQVMDGCFNILMDKIHGCEGTINQFTGDGVMALFGAPVAHEDHAQRACQAALEIQEALKRYASELKKRHGISFRMRIGLNSGLVVVGSIGDDLRMDYTAVGNTTNLASRLETLAEPGHILLSGHTHKIIGNAFRCRPMGKHPVKGKGKPVEVFRLESGSARVGPGPSPEQSIGSRMLGRDRELDRLERLVAGALEGEGSIVNIIGEGGVGKSRLTAELKKRPVIRKVLLLQGRAISMGRNLSFHPIIELLRTWAEIKELDSEQDTFSKMRSAIRRVCGPDAEEVFPFVATLMGIKLYGRYAERVQGIEGEPLERLIVKNLRHLLIRAAEKTPLVILLEDLHWADTSSVYLLESMFRLAETERIVFINVFRPGYKDSGERIDRTVRERYPSIYVVIGLEPMDERTSGALVDSMLKMTKVHYRFRQKLIDLAGGNPFFIEEVVRSLIDQDAVVWRHGAYEATEKIQRLVIPQTINSLLTARIDRLEDKTKSLIKDASVIGRSFFFRVLAEMEKAMDDMDRRVEFLVESQFIRKRVRMEELEYYFRHVLVQEAAYASILYRNRRALHLRVARSIERVFSGRIHEFYGMLAYHYSRGEDAEKTKEYLLKAGEEALKSSASSEALHYYQEALELYLRKFGHALDADRIAMIERNIALALYNKGQYEEAVEQFDRTLKARGVASGTHAPGTMIRLIGAVIHLVTALYLPALKFRKTPSEIDQDTMDLYFKKCKALAMIHPKRFFLESLSLLRLLTSFDLSRMRNSVVILSGTSSLFSFTGLSFTLSRKILDASKQRLKKEPDGASLVFEFLETIHNYVAGNWKEIRDVNEDLVTRSLNLGESYEASQHLYWHGFPAIYRGFLEKARCSVRRLEDIYTTYGNDISLLFKHELNTHLLMESCRYPEALRESEKGLAFIEKRGTGFFSLEMYACRAWIFIRRGELEEAEDSLRRAETILQDLESPVPLQLSGYYRSRTAYHLCRLENALSSGDAREVSSHRRKADRFGKIHLRISRRTAQHRTESYQLRGEFFWLLNRPGVAVKWWRKAIREGERLGARLQLSRVYFTVGKRLQEGGRADGSLDGLRAETYLDRARLLFEQMGLQEGAPEERAGVARSG